MTRSQAYVDRTFAALLLDEREDYEALIEELSDHIASHGTTAGIAHHNRALAHWEIGQVDEALQDFGEAERLLPGDSMPSQLKGMLLEKLGRHDEALAALDRAIRISPDEVTTRRTRALLLVAMGRLEASLPDFDHAIRLAPSFRRTVQDRDQVLARLNTTPGAARPRKWWPPWK